MFCCASGPHSSQEPLGISIDVVALHHRADHPHPLMAKVIEFRSFLFVFSLLFFDLVFIYLLLFVFKAFFLCFCFFAVHGPLLNGANLHRKPFAPVVDPFKCDLIRCCGHNENSEAPIANQERTKCSERPSGAEMAMNLYIYK